MSGMMAKLSWIDAYNFARVNPGQASAALLLVWPLFIAFAAVLVALSPVVFPGAMIAAYVLKHTNAPAIEKPKPRRAPRPAPATPRCTLRCSPTPTCVSVHDTRFPASDRARPRRLDVSRPPRARVERSSAHLLGWR